MSSIYFIVERSVVILGLIGGLWTLYDKWKHRQPKLKLFIPQYRTLDDKSGAKLFLIFVRISNSSNRAACLYLDRMEVCIKTDKWYDCALPPLPAKGLNVAEISEVEYRYFGFDKCKYLNKYDDNTVTFDKPLSGYIVLTHFDNPFSENPVQEVKITVEDCHGKKYIMSDNTSRLSKLDFNVANKPTPGKDLQS